MSDHDSHETLIPKQPINDGAVGRTLTATCSKANQNIELSNIFSHVYRDLTNTDLDSTLLA